MKWEKLLQSLSWNNFTLGSLVLIFLFIYLFIYWPYTISFTLYCCNFFLNVKRKNTIKYKKKIIREESYFLFDWVGIMNRKTFGSFFFQLILGSILRQNKIIISSTISYSVRGGVLRDKRSRSSWNDNGQEYSSVILWKRRKWGWEMGGGGVWCRVLSSLEALPPKRVWSLSRFGL